MSKVLLLTAKEIKAQSPLNGNIDPEKFTEAIRTTQDLTLAPLLGLTLFEAIEADFIANNGEVTDPANKILFDTYIKRGLVYLSAATVARFHNISFSNGGAQKHEGDHSTQVGLKELENYISKLEDLGESYNKRMIKYIETNLSLYPNYSLNKVEEIRNVKAVNINLHTPSGVEVGSGCFWD